MSCGPLADHCELKATTQGLQGRDAVVVEADDAVAVVQVHVAGYEFRASDIAAAGRKRLAPNIAAHLTTADRTGLGAAPEVQGQRRWVESRAVASTP